MLAGGAIVSVLIAVGAERFAYRPLRNAPRLAPLITAIGLSLALQQAIFIWYPGADNAVNFPCSAPTRTTSAPSAFSAATSSSSPPPSSA